MAADKQVRSVNLGKLREVPFAGHTITTGFFKEPFPGSSRARALGLDGDVQADLTVHGGIDKAIYTYPAEHYERWATLLQGAALQPGSFGENLTTLGLTEAQVYIGDVFRVGEALLQVTQPRSPCFKLQIRFNRQDAVALFVQMGCPGWYTSVLQEGAIQAGDPIVLVERAQEAISIRDVWELCFTRSATAVEQRQVQSLPWLTTFWKDRVGRNG